MEYYEKLKELRVQSGMSQDELAEKLHVARQTVSKWEHGINEPDIYTLKQYAAIFDMTLDELVGDVEQVNKPTNKLRKACKTLLFVSTALYVFNIMVVCILFRFLQNKIPVDYNLLSETDSYVNKTEVLLNLLFFTFFYAITLFTYNIGEKNLGTPLLNLDNVAFLVIFSVIVAVPIGFLAFVLAISTQYLIEYSASSFVMCVVCALGLILAIAAHPKITPKNNLIGFRTKFTLTNAEAWVKVNRFASICISVALALVIAVNMVFISYWTILCATIALFATLLITIIYHEILRKKLKQR